MNSERAKPVWQEMLHRARNSIWGILLGASALAVVNMAALAGFMYWIKSVKVARSLEPPSRFYDVEGRCRVTTETEDFRVAGVVESTNSKEAGQRIDALIKTVSSDDSMKVGKAYEPPAGVTVASEQWTDKETLEGLHSIGAQGFYIVLVDSSSGHGVVGELRVDEVPVDCQLTLTAISTELGEIRQLTH